MSDDNGGRRIQRAQKGRQEADFQMWLIEEDRQRRHWYADVQEFTDLEHFEMARNEPAELASVANWKAHLGKVLMMPFQAHRYVAILRDRAEARLAQAQARESRYPPGDNQAALILNKHKASDILDCETGDEFYVLQIEPSFSPKMTIRMERNGNDMRVLGQISDFMVWAHVDRLLTGDEWSNFIKTINDVSFWEIPPDENQFGLDGETWTLKGRCGSRNHVINRWSPVEEQFDQIRQAFLEFAGLFPLPGTMRPEINGPYRHWSTAYLKSYFKRFEPYAGSHSDVDRALAKTRYYLWDRQYPLENISEPYTSDNAEIWKTYLRQIDASPFPEHPVVLEKRGRALRGLAMATGPSGNA